MGRFPKNAFNILLFTLGLSINKLIILLNVMPKADTALKALLKLCRLYHGQ